MLLGLRKFTLFRQSQSKTDGFLDFLESLKKLPLANLLAWSDIRQRYRRSTLGPFWITVSTAVMITCIGFLFGNLFKSSQKEFLPFVAIGLILWSFFSTTIIESCSAFTNAENIIKQLPLPLFLHIERVILRNFYIFLHNIILYPIICILISKQVSLIALLAIPGFFLVVLNLTWISMSLAVICTRFRDMTQIVISLLQIVFYITPIIWMPGLLSEKTSKLVLTPNPFYHLLEVVRAPLMGYSPTFSNWSVCVTMGLAGTAFSLMIFNSFRKKVSYWL